MAKKHPEPFWRKQVGCYYVQVGKKQHRLSADKEEAWRIYHKLMSEPGEVSAPGKIEEEMAVGVIDKFLGWVDANRSPSTFDLYRRILRQFAVTIPKTILVADLKPYHITRVMDSHAKVWGPNTRRNFAVTVMRAFKWAEDQGIIARNPVRVVAKPARQAREQVVTPEDHTKILAAASSSQFRDLIELAWETGSRPQELRAIEARHVDREGRRIVFPISEAKGKKAMRVIYLGTEKAREIVSRLVALYPTGPILLNTGGTPWRRHSIYSAFARITKKTGLKTHLGAYRKGFVTQALKNGVDTVTLAYLVGHTDASMIARVYGRVTQDPSFMEEASRRARGEKPREE